MKTLYVTIIPGGRAGYEMKKRTISLEGINLKDEDALEELIDEEMIGPNMEDDMDDVFQTLRGTKDMWVGWDVFGEGVVGFTTDKSKRKELAIKARAFFDGVDENESEWDD